MGKVYLIGSFNTLADAWRRPGKVGASGWSTHSIKEMLAQ